MRFNVWLADNHFNSIHTRCCMYGHTHFICCINDFYQLVHEIQIKHAKIGEKSKIWSKYETRARLERITCSHFAAIVLKWNTFSFFFCSQTPWWCSYIQHISILSIFRFLSYLFSVWIYCDRRKNVTLWIYCKVIRVKKKKE